MEVKWKHTKLFNERDESVQTYLFKKLHMELLNRVRIF
jgi:hypothetical protein